MTRDRLARWWEAVGRDLVLLLVRGEKPRLRRAAGRRGPCARRSSSTRRRKTGEPACPRQLLERARAAAARRPATRGPARAGHGHGARAAARERPGRARSARRRPRRPRLPLEGTLPRQRDSRTGEPLPDRDLRRGRGTITYEGGITLHHAARRRSSGAAATRCASAVRMRGGMRYYVGSWDGEKLVGTHRDGRGRPEVVGTLRAAPLRHRPAAAAPWQNVAWPQEEPRDSHRRPARRRAARGGRGQHPPPRPAPTSSRCSSSSCWPRSSASA